MCDADCKARQSLRGLFLMMEVRSLQLSKISLECTFMAKLPVQAITSGSISVFYKTLTWITLITSSRYSLILGIQSSPYWWINAGIDESENIARIKRKFKAHLNASLNGFRVYTIACIVTLHLKTVRTGKWRRISIFLTSRAHMLQTLNLWCAKNFLSIKKMLKLHAKLSRPKVNFWKRGKFPHVTKLACWFFAPLGYQIDKKTFFFCWWWYIKKLAESHLNKKYGFYNAFMPQLS